MARILARQAAALLGVLLIALLALPLSTAQSTGGDNTTSSTNETGEWPVWVNESREQERHWQQQQFSQLRNETLLVRQEVQNTMTLATQALAVLDALRVNTNLNDNATLARLQQLETSVLDSVANVLSEAQSANYSATAQRQNMTDVLQSLLAGVDDVLENVTEVRNETLAIRLTLNDVNNTTLLSQSRLNEVKNETTLIMQRFVSIDQLRAELHNTTNRFDAMEQHLRTMEEDVTGLRNETFADHFHLNHEVKGAGRLAMAAWNNTNYLMDGQAVILENSTLGDAAHRRDHESIFTKANELAEKADSTKVMFTILFGGMIVGGIIIALLLRKFMPNPYDANAPPAYSTRPASAKLGVQDEVNELDARYASGNGMRGEEGEEEEEEEEGEGVPEQGEGDEEEEMLEEHPHLRGPKPDTELKAAVPPVGRIAPEKKPGLFAGFRKSKEQRAHEAVVDQLASQHDLDPRSQMPCYGTMPDEEKCVGGDGKACRFLTDCAPLHGYTPDEVVPSEAITRRDKAILKEAAKAEAAREVRVKKATAMKARMSGLKSMDVDEPMEVPA